MNNFSIRCEQSLVNRIESILKAKYASKDDCKLLITESYELIESRKQKEKYPLIYWYRNWLVHPILDRSESDLIVQELDKQFDIPEYEQSTCDKIAELFSTKKLRTELKSILLSVNRTLPFFDHFSGWKDFIGSICASLLHKPIMSKKRTKYVSCFYLEESSSDQKIIWVCEAKKPQDPRTVIKVYGHFPLDEFKTDFLDIS